MLVAFIILCVVSLLFVMAAVVIFLGKGDDLIVGYNLSSTKTRNKYHQVRVRIVVGTLLILIAMIVPSLAALLILGYKELVMTLISPIAFILIAATFTAIHLWARKK